VSPVEFCCDTGTSSAIRGPRLLTVCCVTTSVGYHTISTPGYMAAKRQHPCGFESLLLAGSQIWFVAVEGSENKWQKMVVHAGDWM
jgi:hypothetical protein